MLLQDKISLNLRYAMTNGDFDRTEKAARQKTREKRTET